MNKSILHEYNVLPRIAGLNKNLRARHGMLHKNRLENGRGDGGPSEFVQSIAFRERERHLRKRRWPWAWPATESSNGTRTGQEHGEGLRLDMNNWEVDV